MANNYLEFSEVLPHLTAEEADWLRHQLEVVWVFGDGEYAEDALPDDLDRQSVDRIGCRAYRDMEDYDPDFGEDAGFEYAFSKDDQDTEWGRHLCFRTAEYGSVDRVAHLVQQFLKRFRQNDSWSLTWATTCSKPRAGEFGGGAVFVTASDITCNDAYTFVEQQRAALAVSGSAANLPLVGRLRQVVQDLLDCCELNLDEMEQSTRETIRHAQAFLAEGVDDSPQDVRGYVLYDFDFGDLATTNVYDSYPEAADDASELDNVIVMPLVFEKEAGHVAERQSAQPGPYHLAIDGPTFRSQRKLLLKLQGLAVGGILNVPDPGDRELLEGLVELTDELADQAHDKHGVDCLLDAGDRPCECEKSGYFCSGVPGILAHVENGRLAPGAKVERCDLCRRYASDEAALQKMRELGHGLPEAPGLRGGIRV